MMLSNFKVLSMVVALTFLMSCSNNKKNSNFNYGIITKENTATNVIVIDAFFNHPTYEKKDIEEVLTQITDETKSEILDKLGLKIIIRLYPSQRAKEIDGTHWVGMSDFVYDEDSFTVNYNENKIKALNNTNNVDYVKFNDFLEEKGIDVCALSKMFVKIEKQSYIEADQKYDVSDMRNYEYSEKYRETEKSKILEGYGIPDSLQLQIIIMKLYCK